jgi:hypothetical protein
VFPPSCCWWGSLSPLCENGSPPPAGTVFGHPRGALRLRAISARTQTARARCRSFHSATKPRSIQDQFSRNPSLTPRIVGEGEPRPFEGVRKFQRASGLCVPLLSGRRSAVSFGSTAEPKRLSSGTPSEFPEGPTRPFLRSRSRPQRVARTTRCPGRKATRGTRITSRQRGTMSVDRAAFCCCSAGTSELSRPPRRSRAPNPLPSDLPTIRLWRPQASHRRTHTAGITRLHVAASAPSDQPQRDRKLARR